MKGFKIIFGVVFSIIAFHTIVIAANLLNTSSIQFSSNLDTGTPNVQISCKNSMTEQTNNILTCPTYPNYWLKHLDLASSQRVSLEFVPGQTNEVYQVLPWCWSCNFEWGNSIITELFIFEDENNSNNDIFFQLRSDGIYRLITSSFEIQHSIQNLYEYDDDLYILVKKWKSKDDDEELTTVPPVEEFSCTEEGRFRDPQHCNIFHICEAIEEGFVHNKLTCPETTVYCENEDKCGYVEDCPC